MKRFGILAVALAALVMAATPALATNGMNMIGTGAVSSGMGGADVAVPAGCTAIAGNPAQLAQTCNHVVSLGTALLMPQMSVGLPGMSDTDNETQIFPLPFVGYAQRVGNTPFALGVGVFAQGGMGVDFQKVSIAPGVSDDLYSQVAYARLAPTVAYNITDAITMGATVYIGYASLNYDFFPNLPQGMTVTDLSSYTFSGKIGAAWEINDQWAVGAYYISKSTIDFDDGKMKMNFGPGIGTVTYNDVSMDDFTWPQEVDLGLSFRPIPKLTLAFDVSWIDWSSAIDTVTVHAKNPSQQMPAGYDTIDVPFAMGWEDQYVFALGAQYQINDMWTVRCGYNYGKNPVPDENLSPLFPAITEHHATAGFTFSYASFDFDFAYEHAFENTQTNTGTPGPNNPFAGVEVSHYQDTLHFMVSYRF